MLKTYIVNLKRSVDRREHILKETARFPFLDIELVEAVDGRELPGEEIPRLFDTEHFMDRYHGRIPLMGEIGCTLSHRKCYRKLLESDEEYALILEDDATFLYPEKMASYYEACRKLISGKADVILSSSRCLLYTYRRQRVNGFDFYPVHTAFATHAYIINRKAAMKILQKDELPSMVADDWYAIRRMGITIYTPSPELFFTLETLNSTINFSGEFKSTRKSRRYIKYRIYGRYCQFFYLLGDILGFLGNMRKKRFRISRYIDKSNGL
ncbi:glycosyltransferase family 25 protein [Parabacteroides bouchesdurhonensis]|uniref:glycosyltransferase family 25 protein n=1 Tax=Parabacteroides bouchesdurhonensis TaxID=1936995 RepID=UPI000C860092|nr:glycosyltransferase family 25 protein [Parabacteroides bouchesdurhonensis]